MIILYILPIEFTIIIRMTKIIPVFCVILLLISCGTKKTETTRDTDKKQTNTLDKKSSAPTALDNYDLENEEVPFVKITDDLKEISGITFTSDNRMFAHGDEDADIYQVEPATGEVVKRFSLGELLVLTGDFEDIAYANNKFYLLESNGNIYEFSEGDNGKFVDYKKYKTGLNSSNDVEGLCYDNTTNSLLLACKGSPGKEFGKQKAVYSFSLSAMAMDEKPRFLLDPESIRENSAKNEFSPSGIAKNPVSGTFFIIAARGNTIIELNSNGEILNQKTLPEKVHKQAEGIAFKSDGTLYISNEGKNKTARLIEYKMKQ